MYLRCNYIFLSDRWADMFSAKGCHDDPEHKFSHPFLQVKYESETMNSAVVCSQDSYAAHIWIARLLVWDWRIGWLKHQCWFFSPCSSTGSGDVSGRVELSCRLLHLNLSWQTKPRTQDEPGPELQSAPLFPACHVWHDGHLHHVCR